MAASKTVTVYWRGN